MATPQTPSFALGLLFPNQAQKDVVFNADMTAIDTLLQWNVIAIQNVPPSAPNDQDKYVVGTSPTNAWVGHANAVAVWQANGSFWQFYTPKPGWIVSDVQALGLYQWTGTIWSLLATAGTLQTQIASNAMMFALIFGG